MELVNESEAGGDLLTLREIIVWHADDDRGIRQAMGQLLNQTPRLKLSRDFGSAEELLEALQLGPAPHVILLDLKMTGMSGLDAIGPIKQRAPQTHVILFTSFFDSAAQKKALAAGASDFVLKRLSANELVRLIKRFFRIAAPPEKGVISALRITNA